jgi:hypothetical protein
MTHKPFSPDWFAFEFRRTGTNQTDLSNFLSERLPRKIDRSMINKTVLGKRQVQLDELPLVWEFFGHDPIHFYAATQGQTVPTSPQLPRPRPSIARPVAISAQTRDIPVMAATCTEEIGSDRFHLSGNRIEMAPRPPGLSDRQGIYALYVPTTSMSPRFDPGSRLYVDPHRFPKAGDDVVVLLHPNQEGEEPLACIKRLSTQASGKVVVEQYNPLGSEEIEAGRIKAMHRIIPTDELIGS